MSQCLPIPGSFRTTPSARHAVKSDSGIPCDQNIHVTVVLKREAPTSAYDAVEAFAEAHNLAVLERHKAKHNVLLAGTVADMQKAFSVELHAYEERVTGKKLRVRMGPICVPAEFHGDVLAVLGLDNRPVAKPHFRTLTRQMQPHFPGGPKPLTALEVAKLYNFPTDATGKGQTIAMIELGGGYDQRDLDEYFKKLGLKTPDVQSVSVQGCGNSPGSDADGEVVLDISVAGAMAPDAKILVYFCPNTDQGFLAGINAVIHDSNKCGICSISWGSPEAYWTAQAMKAFTQAFETAADMGVTFLAASGDNGSGDGADGNNVDFPASSPFMTGVGGTRLIGHNDVILSETVWNDGDQEGATGGGISTVFPIPDYQAKANVPGNSFRGVPDVASVADPETGYPITLNGDVSVTGGTSSGSPAWAGLIARLNEKRGKNIGFLNHLLYIADPSCFNDVTEGNNGRFKAGQGWDATTGLGSPNGKALEKALG